MHHVIEINPDWKTIAQGLDAERANGTVRGPLHGIPVLTKDNIATDDKVATTGKLSTLRYCLKICANECMSVRWQFGAVGQ